jgi:hypothetical protein
MVGGFDVIVIGQLQCMTEHAQSRWPVRHVGLEVFHQLEQGLNVTFQVDITNQVGLGQTHEILV